MSRTLLAAPLALLIALTLVPAAGATVKTEQLWLDSHELTNDGAAGPVSTTDSLKKSRLYLVDVQGTLSGWELPLWTTGSGGKPPCGAPEPNPMFPSPGVSNGPVGVDAEVLFAAPGASLACLSGAPFPRPAGNFQINRGFGFGDNTPVWSIPNHHRYVYLVYGQQKKAAFSFQFVDAPLDDNYGRLKITVRGARRLDCVLLGWHIWKDEKGKAMFKNLSQCIGWFQKHEKKWDDDSDSDSDD